MTDLDISFDPIASEFIRSQARHAFITGPIGSGKTVAAIHKLLLATSMQAAAPDGVRYTRAAIIRQTLKQLKDTVLSDILHYLGPVVTYKVSDSKISIRSSTLHADWLLYPLETQQDQRRLLSTQLTFAYINEFAEIDPELVSPIYGRLGRYPFGPLGKPSWYGMWGDSNPGIIDSPWWHKLIGDKPPSWDYFQQPCPVDDHGNILPGAENIAHLPPTYYKDLLEDATESWAERYVKGRWTYDLSGKAVYAESFVPNFHIAQESLAGYVQPGRLLIVGLDVGRNPAAVITQFDPTGRWLILEEVHHLNINLPKFIEEHLKPLLYQRHFASCPVLVVVDPWALSKQQLSETTILDYIRQAGFEAFTATTNAIEPRIRAVEDKLMKQRDGKALTLIDRQCCPALIKGFAGNYMFAEKKSGELDPTPVKNHPYSDLHDALQYAALGTGRNVFGRYMRRQYRQEEPPLPAGAWT